MSLLTFVKGTATPGSLPFLILGLLVGLALGWIWPRNVRLATRWLLGLSGLYVVLSLPLVANGIVGRLPPVRPAEAAALSHVVTLVVFDGDNRRGRVREAEQIYAAASPHQLYVLGDRWIVSQLLRDGIPWTRITHDAGMQNTRDQIALLARIAAEPADRPVAVVASRLQMPRVSRLIAADGLVVLLAASAIDEEPPASGARQVIPTAIALRVSRDAIYEHAALLFYRWRGWIGRPDASRGE